jgi:deoxyribonuclease-4
MLGYHVSKKNNFKSSLEEANKNSNITAFQVFVKNPLSLRLVSLTESKRVKESSECKKYVQENNFFLISHASYLFNTAVKDEKWNDKIAAALNDLYYSEMIGGKGSVFHVGKYLKQDPLIGIQHMKEFIESVINELQEKKSSMIYILETSASCGTELLSDMKDLGDFYHSFSTKHKKNLKICIDTCHVFASGYSLISKAEAIAFINLVEEHIQWNNILVVHLNDSKKGCGFGVDRHENLCYGCIGKNDQSGLKYFVNHCNQRNIPMILETPYKSDDVEYETYNMDLKKVREWLS